MSCVVTSMAGGDEVAGEDAPHVAEPDEADGRGHPVSPSAARTSPIARFIDTPAGAPQ